MRSIPLIGILLSIFLVCTATALADIKLNNLEEEYRYGDAVKAQVELEYDKDISGFLKADLICESKGFEYFTTPIYLKEDALETFDLPAITIAPSMKKYCQVRVTVLNIDSERIDTFKSKPFDINKEFEFDVELNKESYSLGDTLTVTGEIKVSEEAFKGATVNVIIENELISFDIDKREFSLKVPLPEDTNSGKQEIIIEVEDSFDNRAQKKVKTTINPFANVLKTTLIKEEYKPGEFMNFSVGVYDQAEEVIVGEIIDVDIRSPSGAKVFTKQVESGKVVQFGFDPKFMKGTYSIIAKYKNISSTTEIEYVKKNETNVTKEEFTLVKEEKTNYWLWSFFILILIVAIVGAGHYLNKKRPEVPNHKRIKW